MLFIQIQRRKWKKMERKKNKKSILFTIFVFSLLSIFSVFFLAVIGYLNFQSNFKDIQQQLYQFLTDTTIDEIENSLQFGKELDNYYGADNILIDLKEKLGEEFEFFIENEKNMVLYSTCDTKPLHSNYFKQEIKDADNEKIGNLVTYYETSVIKNNLIDLETSIFQVTGAIVIGLIIIIVIGICILYCIKKQITILQRFGMLAILIAILLQSAYSLYVYQGKYRNSMKEGAQVIVDNLGDTVGSVLNLGIDLTEVEDLVDYLTEKIDSVPILYNIKLYENIADTSDNTGHQSKFYLSKQLFDTNLTIVADLSSSYINNKIIELILIVVSALILMGMLVFEILKLPTILSYRISSAFNKNQKESYNSIVGIVQLVTFFCTMAEYMCLPYSAMIIRNLNEGVFHLSVSATAALPIAIEGITQMLCIFLLPSIIKQIGSKKVLVLSSILMIGINSIAFFSRSAIQLIVCRAVAGMAYAGFTQIANYVITNGYETEEGRTELLTHKNGGLLAGITCGAGLGAIISSSTTFYVTFLVSAVIFVIYFLTFRFLMPWKLLRKNEEIKREIEKKTEFRYLIKMLSSFEIIKYSIVVFIPINIGVMFMVILIPSFIQQLEMHTILLSYCYIVNGMIGIYLAPKIVRFFAKKMGLHVGVAAALLMGAVSLILLDIPSPVVVIIIASALLGFVDGVGTPMATEQFIGLPVVESSVNETTAFLCLSAISYIINAIAPIVITTITGERIAGMSRYHIVSAIFLVCAIIVIVTYKKKTKKCDRK